MSNNNQWADKPFRWLGDVLGRYDPYFGTMRPPTLLRLALSTAVRVVSEKRLVLVWPEGLFSCSFVGRSSLSLLILSSVCSSQALHRVDSVVLFCGD